MGVISIALMAIILATTLKEKGDKYKHEYCKIQIIHQKGELYEKVKRECKKIEVFDKDWNLIEVIENK